MPAGPVDNPTAAAEVLGRLGEALNLLADPVILGQAIEAGYIDVEAPAEGAASDEVLEVSAHDAGT
jgi:hypothetical protein